MRRTETDHHALANAGNALKLKDTRFLTWNGLLQELGDTVEGTCAEYSVQAGVKTCLKSSPIPPGFFENLGIDTVSLTGEANIREYFEGKSWKQVRLVEMLCCHMGCHNGDGVTTDEKKV